MPLLTNSTCNESCWTAEEPECKCSCGGRNHGIMRHGRNPENMPARTSRVKTHWYKFHAATTSYSDAHHEAYRLAKELDPHAYYLAGAGDSYFVRTASPSQRKWPEVANILAAALESIPEENRARYAEAPVYIIWQKITDPLTVFKQDQDSRTRTAAPAPQDPPRTTGAHDPQDQDPPAGAGAAPADAAGAPMPPEPPIIGAAPNRVAESRFRQDQESELASQPRLF